ncbi:MAG TPA: peptide-methionine (S)-S-oxide reductase MsrA [Candidatus Saccharibacteria bacterium]|nr:peptide-methionine (S)-S-oxide reductase MsrA [Candidatus Saccharibacteria bacterium]HRQ98350.1 peptide-methionine (S)-S-oxide reductase MsrA [Candidatus Saccharibacteria bacterium]
MTTYTLAGGCFWCLDAVYRRIKGVQSVVSGYSGGEVANPTYEQVSTGTTGHAEAVQVTFDENVIPESVILDIFFLIHDPTTLDRQGNDIGPQYRSAMFYANDAQEKEFLDAKSRAIEHWGDTILTEITKLDEFYPAGEEHQDYFNKTPESGYCQIVIAPKITKARAKYSQWFKAS